VGKKKPDKDREKEGKVEGTVFMAPLGQNVGRDQGWKGPETWGVGSDMWGRKVKGKGHLVQGWAKGRGKHKGGEEAKNVLQPEGSRLSEDELGKKRLVGRVKKVMKGEDLGGGKLKERKRPKGGKLETIWREPQPEEKVRPNRVGGGGNKGIRRKKGGD